MTIELNDKGQCPFCFRKPLTYKRSNYYFCARCDRAYNLETGVFQENWHWDKDNNCKHPGRSSKHLECFTCGEKEPALSDKSNPETFNPSLLKNV